MIDIDEHYKYFGFEISIDPNSEEFKNSCLRTPDFLFGISPIKSESNKSWLVLWRSYENCESERGLAIKDKIEIDSENSLSFLPLSVVLFGFADMNMIGRVCTRFFSIVPHSANNESHCDMPPVNLMLIKNRLSCSGNNIHIEVCSLRHLNSLYRRKKLIPYPLWQVSNEIVKNYALDLLTRASYIVSIIHDEMSFQCILPFYNELSHYAGLLFGSFEDRNFHVAKEDEKRRKLYKNLMFEKWYSGSRHQQKIYPSGLMKDWVADIGRYVLYDFQLGRRLKYRESRGKGYIIECDNEQDALFFDRAQSYHVLPENIPPLLIHVSTEDWIRVAP